VELAPAIVAAEPRMAPPSAIAPCEIMMTIAFGRPRAQVGYRALGRRMSRRRRTGRGNRYYWNGDLR
jgi:hypothetical protein